MRVNYKNSIFSPLIFHLNQTKKFSILHISTLSTKHKWGKLKSFLSSHFSILSIFLSSHFSILPTKWALNMWHRRSHQVPWCTHPKIFSYNQPQPKAKLMETYINIWPLGRLWTLIWLQFRGVRRVVWCGFDPFLAPHFAVWFTQKYNRITRYFCDHICDAVWFRV